MRRFNFDMSYRNYWSAHTITVPKLTAHHHFPGKKGVGLGKRPASPGATEKQAKLAKLDDEAERESYRIRTREEYEERRAEGRLLSATRTLLTLDEKAEVEVRPLLIPCVFESLMIGVFGVLANGRSMLRSVSY